MDKLDNKIVEDMFKNILDPEGIEILKGCFEEYFNTLIEEEICPNCSLELYKDFSISTQNFYINFMNRHGMDKVKVNKGLSINLKLITQVAKILAYHEKEGEDESSMEV